MEGRSFDGVARRWATGASRRGALGLLVGAVLSAVLGQEPAEARRRRRCRQRGQACRRSRQCCGQQLDCASNGNPLAGRVCCGQRGFGCSDGSQCCGGFVCNPGTRTCT